MKFRPCIDLHVGQVKQIVGSTLADEDDGSTADTLLPKRKLSTNFSTDRPASEFAAMYKRDNLYGGHVIKLGPGNDDAAKKALACFLGGLQIGGGITVDNATFWLEAGASHVIVTSFVFRDGRIDWGRLESLSNLVGKNRLVLDLSCRRQSGGTGPYFVVTDRWQTYTDVVLDCGTLQQLANYCDEFLVHGVENEGKRCGILEDLVVILGEHSPIPVTYAGGIRDMNDVELVKRAGKGKVDVTIGSALDCFGGDLSYGEVVKWHQRENTKS